MITEKQDNDNITMSCCAGSKGENNGKLSDNIQEDVKEYYGKRLTKSDDLQTTATTCALGQMRIPKVVREALGKVHEEVTGRFYGCGLVVPESLKGMHILDLGSGSGQDCYVLCQLVGESGQVIGLDMTDEQLAVANKHIDYHREKFGYKESNVKFVKGYIEKLGEAGLQDNTFDIIVSNCVVNLSPDKKSVLKEAYRVLKEGGEFYFSDVYADRQLTEEIRSHKVLWGECVSGALYWKDLVKLAEEIGFARPHMSTAHKYDVCKQELLDVLGDARFASVTYRLFKLPKQKEDPCQVTYDGSAVGHEKSITLDYLNIFPEGEKKSVDSEVATILQSSRLKNHFTFEPAHKKSAEESGVQTPSMDPFYYIQNINPKKDSSGKQTCCGGKTKEQEKGVAVKQQQTCSSDTAKQQKCGDNTAKKQTCCDNTAKKQKCCDNTAKQQKCCDDTAKEQKCCSDAAKDQKSC